MQDAATDVGERDMAEEKRSTSPTEVLSPSISRNYITGFRLHSMTISILLSLLLVNIEVSIVSTSLQTIADALNGFSSMGWVISGYMVTYTSLLIIIPKISDILGRRSTLVISQAVFAIFSGGCTAAQTIVQLIVCRAFQGIGAAGCAALPVLILYEMVPPQRYPLYGALVSCATALGSLTGPLIGGILSERSSWRWVFGVGIAPMVLAAVLFYLSTPQGFPKQGSPEPTAPSLRQRLSFSSLARLDAGGCVLLLGGSLLLVTALLEGGTHFAWSSAAAIILLIFSGILLLMFLALERRVTSSNSRQEPLFPWRFVVNRVWIGTLLSMFLCAIPYNLLMISLPQRFQIMHGLSPFQAGVRLIPFNGMISFGGILISVIAGKTRIAPIYLLFISSIVQLAGTIPLAYMPIQHAISGRIYAFQVLIGLGVGMMFGLTVLLPPHMVELRDLATATGALLQFRVFGGCLGVAIGTAVLNNHLRTKLGSVLSSSDLDRLFKSPNLASNPVPQDVKERVFRAFGEGYNIQFKVLIAFGVIQLLAVALIWRNPQVRLYKVEKASETKGSKRSLEIRAIES